MSRSKRAVLFALTAATALLLLTEVAVAQKPYSEVDEAAAAVAAEQGEALASGSDG